MRAPLLRTSWLFRPQMSTSQEVPTNTVDAEGAATIQVQVNRDNAGKITSSAGPRRNALTATSSAAEPLQTAIPWLRPRRWARPSSKRRTIETSKFLAAKGYKVRQRSQMSQLNPGVCEKKSEKQIREEYPEEIEKHEFDPYHHRYPRAEVRPFSNLRDPKSLTCLVIP